MPDSVCELVRKNELEYTRGTTQLSKYVNFQMFDTINTIEAYLNSQHTTGEVDSLGREKPFFNIVVAAANIWMRATDIDRSHIKIRATSSKDFIDSFMATVLLQDWMRRENFGAYLNEWGRTLARYGSAVTKTIENKTGLHMSVVPWNRLICDPIDFEANPKIEPIDLTEAELFKRIQTHGYNPLVVSQLMDSLKTRETLDKRRKDNRLGYIRIYEVHGVLSLKLLKNAQGSPADDGDEDRFTQCMAVISFVGKKNGRKTEYDDFVLFAGKEASDPYDIDHLIKEDGRSLSIGAVEHLFQSQWMANHAIKTEKDTLDLASRLVFQTADGNFLNMNVLDNIESGDVLVHTLNMPLSQIQTAKPDIVSMMNFRASWREVGNEIAGISNAMLGITPRAGSSARFQQTLLKESYSLFELMTENKGLALESKMRNRILPYLKTKMDTTKEVSATLEAHDVDRIDGIFIKNEAIKLTNTYIIEAINTNLDRIAQKQPVLPIDAGAMFARNIKGLQDSMSVLGNQRFFKPSDLSDKTWKEQFKNLEWEVEVDITGENTDTQQAMQALNNALAIIMAPGYAQNKQAQAVVARIFELAGAMSPVQFSAIPPPPPPAPPPPADGSSKSAPASSTGGDLPDNRVLIQ